MRELNVRLGYHDVLLIKLYVIHVSEANMVARTHRHDVTKHQVVAMIDEELQHDLQRRPFALQER